MAKKTEPSKYAAALQYLQQMRDRAADFGGGVVDTLGNRARDVGGLAYEALTSDPNISRMNTAEFSQAAADRPSTPRLDAAVQGIGEMGKALVTQPVQTAKAIVVDPVVDAFESPRAMGQFAGEFVNPLRIAAALRKTAPIAELDVYHGTPHRFDPTEENPLGEFDASKIGTGEGAQAYGHGIYLAEAPEVAKGYATTLANRDSANQGRLNAHANAKRLANLAGESKAAADDIRYALESEPNHSQKELLTQTLQMLESGEYKQPLKNTGSLYKADLPDEMIDRMLDWDKPLSEQSEAVQKALGSLQNNAASMSYGDMLTSLKVAPHLQNAKDYPFMHPKGSDIYNSFGDAMMVGNSAKGQISASDKLKALGIPGIRYLDAGSRDGGSGTRNFVVFPGEEKKVRILERK